jgi:hypothetical protein
MIPTKPEDLLAIEGEMKRVKAAIAAQQGSARAVGDTLTEERLSDVLGELDELDGHLVGASVAKIRNSITALKTKLREAGLGDAAGLYGKAVGMWEALLADGLQSMGLGEAVTELDALNSQWRTYADRFYSRTVRNLLGADKAQLPQLGEASVRVGPATEIRAALGDVQLDDWTNFALQKTRAMPADERNALLKYLYGDPKAGLRASEVLQYAEASVSSTSLVQARSQVMRAMQSANPTERQTLQNVLNELDKKLTALSVPARDRDSVSRIVQALEADAELINSNWARDIRSQIKTADEISQQISLVRQAEAVSPEAGQVARRAILEKYLLPNGENTTARQIAEQFRKKRPQIERIIGETELSEADLHELFKQLERLAEKLGNPSWLNAKAPLLSEVFESFQFTKPSPPPLG